MIEERVKDVIKDVLKDNNLLLDSVKYEKEGNNNFLRIVVDGDKIIDIDTIVEITKILNPILDDADIIKDSYILDVSSKEKGE